MRASRIEKHDRFCLATDVRDSTCSTHLLITAVRQRLLMGNCVLPNAGQHTMETDVGPWKSPSVPRQKLDPGSTPVSRGLKLQDAWLQWGCAGHACYRLESLIVPAQERTLCLQSLHSGDGWCCTTAELTRHLAARTPLAQDLLQHRCCDRCAAATSSMAATSAAGSRESLQHKAKPWMRVSGVQSQLPLSLERYLPL